MIDTIDLIFKLSTLFFLAATSELAFRKRSWGIMVLTLGLWLTIFRASILRATVIYAGIFNHTPQNIISIIQKSLMGGEIVIFTDVVAFIGSVITFIFIASEMNGKLKRVKKL